VKTDSDAVLAARFAAIYDGHDDSDWQDVLRRRIASADVPRRRFRSARLVVLLAALAAAATVALVAPWDRSKGSLSDLALAAIGSEPVLHVVGEFPTGAELVEIRSSKAEPVMQQEESWYDQARGLKHTIMRSGTKVVDDTLDTPHGSYYPGGIVYDCTWIAAHPVAATKARVSCNASGNNGTTPHVVPRPKPTLNPGLAGFLDGYRKALGNGSAHESGKGQLDGHPVEWLEFKTNGGTERVALDAGTHKPLLVTDGSGWSLRIHTVETLAAETADFSHPRPDELGPQPNFGSANRQQVLALDAVAIAAAVPGGLWAGASLSGLQLVAARRADLKTTFVHGTPAPETGTGLELDYGALASSGRLDMSRSFVQIREAPSAALSAGYMWAVRGQEPPSGHLYAMKMGGGTAYGPGGKPLSLSALLVIGFTVIDGKYVTIQASNRKLLVAAGRSLRPAGR
jgi:hypothetical protein